MKNYPTHDFTERPLSSEKEIKLDMNKPEDLDLICKFGKAISNKYCLLIFKEISKKPMNMIEISRKTNIPISSVSKHIDTLQAAQMIFVNHQPGLKGHAKICYKQITGAQAKALMDSETNYIIIDARTQSEYDAGHIEGAILMPETEVAKRAEIELPDKDQLILVYCRSGRRSKIAAQALVDLGYTNVKEFGGIIDWEYEIVK
jgi:rhodanese-related sulfurtransferase